MKDKKTNSKPKKVKKTEHILTKDVVIGNVMRKKGYRVALTETGFKYFKLKNYIK